MYLNVRMIQYSSFQVQNFGEPFFLVVRENETLTEVKQRIQKKLMISDDEFSKVCVVQHLTYGILNCFVSTWVFFMTAWDYGALKKPSWYRVH